MPTPEFRIALPKDRYDEMLADVRTGHHTRSHPLKIRFNHDEFTTLIWADGDVLWSRDPVNGERRIDPLDQQMLTHGYEFSGFKAFLMACLVEAGVEMTLAVDITGRYKQLCKAIDELSGSDKDLFNTLMAHVCSESARLAGISDDALMSAMDRMNKRSEDRHKTTTAAK